MRNAKMLASLLVVGLAACAQPSVTSPRMLPPDAAPPLRDHAIQQRNFTRLPHAPLRRAINAERGRAGLNPLEYHQAVARVAQEHADDMVKNEYFDKDAPSGLGWDQRLSNAGLTKFSAKVLLRVVTPEPSTTYGQRILFDDPDGWMNTDRSSVLKKERTHIGIGAAFHPRENVWYVVAYLVNFF